jgi:hypothetical protein
MMPHFSASAPMLAKAAPSVHFWFDWSSLEEIDRLVNEQLGKLDHDQ